MPADAGGMGLEKSAFVRGALNRIDSEQFSHPLSSDSLRGRLGTPGWCTEAGQVRESDDAGRSKMRCFHLRRCLVIGMSRPTALPTTTSSISSLGAPDSTISVANRINRLERFCDTGVHALHCSMPPGVRPPRSHDAIDAARLVDPDVVAAITGPAFDPQVLRQTFQQEALSPAFRADEACHEGDAAT